MNGQRLKHDPYSVYLGVTLDRIFSHREHLSCSAAKIKSRNNLIMKLAGTSGVPAQAPSAHQPWLYATQSQNTAVQCVPDPASQISSTPDFIVQCAWFQSACNPHSSHGCQCSAVLHLLLYVVKRQLTMCFKSSKPIQIGLCMLMSLSIHLHGLHLSAQYRQTWHLSTQLRSREKTGRRLLWSIRLLLPTILSDSQVSISLVICGLWRTVSGQVKAHVMLTCTNGVSPNHFLVIVTSDRPWTTMSTRAH